MPVKRQQIWDLKWVLILGFWIGRKRVRVEGLKMGLNLRWELGEIVGGVKIRVLEREGLRVFEKKVREKEETAIFQKFSVWFSGNFLLLCYRPHLYFHHGVNVHIIP